MRLVLIHGAWQGAWAWDALVPLLAAAGHEVVAVDLPGNGTDDTPPAAVSLDLYVDHVASRLGEKAVLVAHSGGGVTASQTAEAAPDRVAGIAYVAGMMLPDGTGFAEVVAPVAAAEPTAAGIRPHLVWSADRLVSTVPADAARAIFFHDVAEPAARTAAARLSAQPEGGRAVRPRLTADRFGRVPRLYVEAARDRSVVPAVQRRMQALVPGAVVRRLDCGHAPQLSQPRQLADCLNSWLGGLT